MVWNWFNNDKEIKRLEKRLDFYMDGLSALRTVVGEKAEGGECDFLRDVLEALLDHLGLNIIYKQEDRYDPRYKEVKPEYVYKVVKKTKEEKKRERQQEKKHKDIIDAYKKFKDSMRGN